ncbi:unnamed protein product [Paramecium octaurelia]|uniref:Uncharacterized protein n=1 Tax=Paramecium octaurelia TaxID=43137 RepID=A0A8S1YQY2_PAROT|nr:unnamed protein product [Paramecium octaurelia]
MKEIDSDLIQKNSFRRVLGLNKSFPKSFIVGRLEFDLSEISIFENKSRYLCSNIIQMAIRLRILRGFITCNFTITSSGHCSKMITWGFPMARSNAESVEY